MTISEVSKKYNLTPETLRWYEKIGLLRNINRHENKLRDYTEENCNAIEFVKCMRDAGVSIETLIKYMDLMEKGDSTLEERRKLLLDQRNDLTEKMTALKNSIKRLDYKIENYDKIILKKTVK